MSISIRVCRLNISLANSLLHKTNLINVGARFMYTERSLGLPAYEERRIIYRNQFASIVDSFRQKMAEVCEKPDGVIFTDDVKAMAHLAQKNDADIELVVKMIEKYVDTHNTMELRSFAFGPIVMRLFYHLNEPNVALSLFTKPSMKLFFNQVSSYQILFSLLYKHDKYNEIRELFQEISNEDNKVLMRSASVVLAAASFKQNTPEALQFVVQYWKDTADDGYHSFKFITILGGLALKQNLPDLTISILSSARAQYFINVRCLKILAYAQLNAFLQIVPILQHSIEMSNTYKHTYYRDVVDMVESMASANRDQAGAGSVLELLEILKNGQRITETTLDSALLHPIEFRRPRNYVQQDKQRNEFTHDRIRNTM